MKHAMKRSQSRKTTRSDLKSIFLILYWNSLQDLYSPYRTSARVRSHDGNGSQQDCPMHILLRPRNRPGNDCTHTGSRLCREEHPCWRGYGLLCYDYRNNVISIRDYTYTKEFYDILEKISDEIKNKCRNFECVQTIACGGDWDNGSYHILFKPSDEFIKIAKSYGYSE